MTGFLHVNDVPIARVGVFPYQRADGSIEMEAKLPQDLLADSTIASANNRAITNDHPSELVNRDNYAQYGKGMTAENAHSDGNNLRVDMTIMDANLISTIKSGKQELSIGFVTEVVPQKGEYNGIKYDSMQRNIQINHVAVVERGRAGHTVRITGDAAIMTDQSHKGGETQMETTKVLLDGKNITVDADDAETATKANSSLSSLKSQLAEAQAKVKDLQAQIAKASGSSKVAEEAKAKADSLEAENDALKEQIESLKADSIDEKVNARLVLIESAKPYVGDGFDFTGKSEKEVKVAAIKAQNDSFDAADKSDDYINARFDMLEELSADSAQVIAPSFNKDSVDDLTKLQEARYHLNESK